MAWLLTVICGVGKCATLRHEFKPSFPLTRIAFRHLALASPLSCPQPPFLPPRPRLQDTQNHKGQGSSQGEALFAPAPRGARMGRGGHAGGLVCPTLFTHKRGPSLIPPLRSAGRYVIPPAPALLLHANPPPFCALPPVCARTGLAPESRRGRAAAPFMPFLCVAPAPFCAPPFVHEQDSCRCRSIMPRPCTAPAVCGGAEGM
jgi:hypothetical protein